MSIMLRGLLVSLFVALACGSTQAAEPTASDVPVKVLHLYARKSSSDIKLTVNLHGAGKIAGVDRSRWADESNYCDEEASCNGKIQVVKYCTWLYQEGPCANPNGIIFMFERRDVAIKNLVRNFAQGMARQALEGTRGTKANISIVRVTPKDPNSPGIAYLGYVSASGKLYCYYFVLGEINAKNVKQSCSDYSVKEQNLIVDINNFW